MQGQPNDLMRRGLTLSRGALRRLKDVGIVVQSNISLEHQNLARRYVLRGIESGGAIKDLGRYVTFCGPGGEPLPYLYPIDVIGVNGVHAVVVGTVLVRIELFRAGRTCQLLITKHQPRSIENGRRPAVESQILYRGVNGLLDVDALGKQLQRIEWEVPQFWSRGGEQHAIPAPFAAAVRAASKGATCLGCTHAHYLAPPVVEVGMGQ